MAPRIYGGYVKSIVIPDILYNYMELLQKFAGAAGNMRSFLYSWIYIYRSMLVSQNYTRIGEPLNEIDLHVNNIFIANWMMGMKAICCRQ